VQVILMMRKDHFLIKRFQLRDESIFGVVQPDLLFCTIARLLKI